MNALREESTTRPSVTISVVGKTSFSDDGRLDDRNEGENDREMDPEESETNFNEQLTPKPARHNITHFAHRFI